MHQSQILHFDKGVQYAANSYKTLLASHHVAISIAEVGTAWQNGYAERAIRTIKEEETEPTEFRACLDSLRQTESLLDEAHMNRRIPSSLSFSTPVEYEEQWAEGQAHLISQGCWV